MPPTVAITVPPLFKVPGLVKERDPTVIGVGLPPVTLPVKTPMKGAPMTVIPPPLIKLFACRVIPPMPVVVTSVVKWTAPPVSVIAIEVALTIATVIFVQLLTVNAPISVVPPIAPDALISPVPAVIVRF